MLHHEVVLPSGGSLVVTLSVLQACFPVMELWAQLMPEKRGLKQSWEFHVPNLLGGTTQNRIRQAVHGWNFVAS